MIRTLLVRGLMVGAIAGLASAVFAYFVGEPALDIGIAFEEHASAAAGEHAEAELVTRDVQSTLGLAVAVVIYGAALGGIFALVFAGLSGRLGRLGARSMAAALALAAYVVVIVVPFLQYPSNPPGTSDSATAGQRTGLYLTMVLVSIAVAIAAFVLGRRLAPRFGVWNASVLAVGGYVVAAGFAVSLMPTINETPDGFPAAALWEFRMASLGTQAVLWATLGLLFGWLTARNAAERPRALNTEFRVNAPAH